jgi:hypothetical protein
MTEEKEPTQEELMLPWYVSGRLSPEEREQFERALATSPSLRLALDTEHRLQAAVATAPTPEPPAIDPESLLPRRLQAAAMPRWAMPMAAAAAVVIVVQAAGLAWLSQPAVYRTASAPAPAPKAQAVRYAVHFLDDATAGRIRTALDEAEAAILRGPLPDGAFIIEVRNGEAAMAILNRSGVAKTIVRTD